MSNLITGGASPRFVSAVVMAAHGRWDEVLVALGVEVQTHKQQGFCPLCYNRNCFRVNGTDMQTADPDCHGIDSHIQGPGFARLLVTIHKAGKARVVVLFGWAIEGSDPLLDDETDPVTFHPASVEV